MKRLLLVVMFTAFAASVSAQTITCSVSGATTKQATQYAAMLTKVNADRVAAGKAAFTGFPPHCAEVMMAEFTSWVELQDRIDAEKISSAAKTRGDETALPAHCTAAGLSAGCLKVQVACFILTGNVTCN